VNWGDPPLQQRGKVVNFSVLSERGNNSGGYPIPEEFRAKLDLVLARTIPGRPTNLREPLPAAPETPKEAAQGSD